MSNTYGGAPIYFSGAILFFASGGTLIYYDQSIIGAIVMAPSSILLGLAFFTLVTLSRVKSSDNDVNVVISDPELMKQLKKHQQTATPYKKWKGKKPKI